MIFFMERFSCRIRKVINNITISILGNGVYRFEEE